MLPLIPKIFTPLVLSLLAAIAHSQTISSTANGIWNDPSTWSGGIVPTSMNATQIIVNHEVVLPTAYAISVYRLIVNNRLALNNGANLTILEDAFASIPDFLVTGTLVLEDGAALNGTTVTNTFFESGSVYIHRQGPLGFVPLATWHNNSTFMIAGFTGSGYINIAHSEGWKQNFGHVVYDCSGQTIFVVDLNGYLRNIAGDFIIRNTRNQTLRLSTTQSPLISIGGSLIVEGSSEVWFSTNGSNTVVDIQKDFIYRSTSSGPSYFTTRGVCAVNVAGDFELDSPGPLRMTSSTADSIGARQATLSLGGDFKIYSGTIIAPPSGSGKGTIIFEGTGIQTVVSSSAGASFQGNLDYVIESASTVSLGNSALSNTSGMLHVKGRIQVGSTDPGGAIQLINKGNIHIPGQRIFDEGSVVEYQGTAPQWISDGHPSVAGVTLVCNNSAVITITHDLVVADFRIQLGTVQSSNSTISIHGDLLLDQGVTWQSGSISLLGALDQQVSAEGQRLKDLIINKPPDTQVTLLSPLNLSGMLSILSTGTRFNANGYLTLLSESDDAGGSAGIGPLPSGSEVYGDVTVQRFMSGEGRIYRYISSPVENASVADLMDDFPVTGTFTDPSAGPGINSTSPSFYHYNESMGTLQAGWLPYPSLGLAQDNPLEPGRGYAAYIRDATGSTIWDVTGRLNQGNVSLPIQYTDNGAASNGWNLVGNPYACAIDWDITGANGWVRQNISPIISIRDNGVGGGGTFLYWDGDNSYDDIPNGHIAPGQSFWVRATGVNPVLTIREGVKVAGDAAFFRKQQDGIPGFALILSHDGITDKTFFKIRKGASSDIDDWDAVKLENEQFDISTVLPCNISLAIQARDQFPCQSEIIPIGIKDLNAGTYDLSLMTRFDFRNFRYSLIDAYLNRETELSTESKIEFTVAEDTASAAFGRFALRLDEVVPDVTLSVSAPRIVCEHEWANVIIRRAQEGIYYSLWTNTGKQLSGESLGDGKDLNVRLYADSLLRGDNVIVVKARAVCRSVNLTKKVIIIKALAPAIRVENAEGLPGSSVIIQASADDDHVSFNWFESELSTDTLVVPTDWSIPKLPTTYYVSGTGSSGCTSKRYPVIAGINDVKSVVWLVSNDSTVSGRINNGEEDELSYDVSPHGLHFYPNPTTGKIKISVLDGKIISIQIVNAAGRAMLTIEGSMEYDENMIDVSLLPEGPYVAIIRGTRRSYFVRFVKLDR